MRPRIPSGDRTGTPVVASSTAEPERTTGPPVPQAVGANAKTAVAAVATVATMLQPAALAHDTKGDATLASVASAVVGEILRMAETLLQMAALVGHDHVLRYGVKAAGRKV